jgi:ethanolamine ammonia-lyase small subunit
MLEVCTEARDKQEYLARPDLGRRLNRAAADVLRDFPRGAQLQVALGDGLSAAAVAAHIPCLLPLLATGALDRDWPFGRPFFIRHCRVGILNEIGALLEPTVAVLLIGERPGLAHADSLSAYLAFRPRPGHTDADRNLISNIHAHGTLPAAAASGILQLAGQMIEAGRSGITLNRGPDALSEPPGDDPSNAPSDARK